MRLATALLVLALLASCGCATFAKNRDEPKPDYKPSAPTREMRF
jgi:hypothetical protein